MEERERKEMLLSYNGVLNVNNESVIICQLNSGGKYQPLPVGDSINIGKEKLKPLTYSEHSAVRITVEIENNVSASANVVSIQKYRKESTKVSYYIRVESCDTSLPHILDSNVEHTTLVQIVGGAVFASKKPAPKIPVELTSEQARDIMTAFRPTEISLSVIDEAGKIQFTNASGVTHKDTAKASKKEKEPAAGVPAKARYDAMEKHSFYLDDNARAVLSMVVHGVETGTLRNPNMMLLGRSGIGKTTIAYILADVLGWKLTKVEPATVADSDEFFGFWTMVDGTTEYQHTDFSKAITEEGSVILVDEINRARSSVLNGVMNLLDETGHITVKNGVLRRAKNVIIVATMNEGSQYAGTYAMDMALANRFALRLEIGYMPEPEEITVLVKKTGVDAATAKKIVYFASMVRKAVGEDVDMSHRTTLNLAALCRTGVSLRAAIEFGFMQGLSADLKKSILDIIKADPSIGRFVAADNVVGNLF